MATIILGITGSIAAFKAADVASQLVKHGHDVHCVCTPRALEFVTPLTLTTLSRNPVVTSFNDDSSDWKPKHIELAEKADLLAIVPATANFMAEMAHGLAPDTLSALYLANRAPVLIFPAMNCHMWAHPATQENARVLATRPNHRVVGPDDEGILACGAEGKGRLLPVERVVEEILKTLP